MRLLGKSKHFLRYDNYKYLFKIPLIAIACLSFILCLLISSLAIANNTLHNNITGIQQPLLKNVLARFEVETNHQQ